MESKAQPYEVFEPFCKWEKDEANDILQIHIQGFKKENLKVQLNNAGYLMITGDDKNKRVKFQKEIKVPEGCIRSDIRAKLTGGILYITMPKKPVETQTKPQPDQQNREQIGKQKLEELVGASDDSRKGWRGLSMFGLKRPQMDGKRALKLGALAAVAVVVSVGAYIAYKYHKCDN